MSWRNLDEPGTVYSDHDFSHSQQLWEVSIALPTLYREGKVQCSILKESVQGLVAKLGFESRIL